MPPFAAPLRLITGHVETLNVKQVPGKMWIEAREDVRNIGLRCFFLQKLKAASFNRNTKFQMFECLCVTRGCDTIAPQIGKSPVYPRSTRVFSAI